VAGRGAGAQVDYGRAGQHESRGAGEGEGARYGVHSIPAVALAMRSPTPLTAPIRPYAVPRLAGVAMSAGMGVKIRPISHNDLHLA
jgi:hypothetical protein